MGIEVIQGQKSRQTLDVEAVKARNLKPYDIVHCGEGVVRTVRETFIVPAEQAGRTTDQVNVRWCGLPDGMNVGVDELFWVQPHVPFHA